MIRVSCAIIENEDKVLLCQRSISMSMPLKWEFPGGKIEIGESPEDAIKREILEELNINILIKKKLPQIIFHYPDISLILFPFICVMDTGIIQLLEHKESLWVNKHSLFFYDLAEADVPIVKEYLNNSFDYGNI